MSLKTVTTKFFRVDDSVIYNPELRNDFTIS